MATKKSDKEPSFDERFKEEQVALATSKYKSSEKIESFDTQGQHVHTLAVVCVMLIHNKIAGVSPNISNIKDFDIMSLSDKQKLRFKRYIDHLIGEDRPKNKATGKISKKIKKKTDTKGAVRKHAVAVSGTAAAKKLATIEAKKSMLYAKYVSMFIRCLLILKLAKVKLVSKS